MKKCCLLVICCMGMLYAADPSADSSKGHETSQLMMSPIDEMQENGDKHKHTSSSVSCSRPQPISRIMKAMEQEGTFFWIDSASNNGSEVITIQHFGDKNGACIERNSWMQLKAIIPIKKTGVLPFIHGQKIWEFYQEQAAGGQVNLCVDKRDKKDYKIIATLRLLTADYPQSLSLKISDDAVEAVLPSKVHEKKPSFMNRLPSLPNLPSLPSLADFFNDESNESSSSSSSSSSRPSNISDGKRSDSKE